MTRLWVIAGHGGNPYDPGSCAGGESEADLVRKLAGVMKDLAPEQVELLDMSRNWYSEKLVNSDLKRRVGRDPVIELHMDAAGSGARGGHVIIKAGYQPDSYDKALANFIKSMFPGRSQVISYRSDLANINRAATLGINYRLLECCFITDDGDRNRFINEAPMLAAGILNVFGIYQEEKKGWLDMLSDQQQNELYNMVKEIHAEVCSHKDPSGRGVTMPPLQQLRFMAGKQATILENTEKLLDRE